MHKIHCIDSIQNMFVAYFPQIFMVYSVVSRSNHSLTPTDRLPVQLGLLRALWLEGGDDAHNGATLATVLEMGWGVRWGWDRPVFP